MTMTIKDLCVSKELDDEASSSVRGGLQSTGQGNIAGGAVALGMGGGIGDVTLALNLPTQINVNTPTFVNMPVAIGVAGNALAI